jgi:DNA-binding SARP family transcriptional activator/DNA-binding XRE family transcriptional regulator
MVSGQVWRRDGAGLNVLVRERRVSAGMTQRELAAAAGVSIGALRDLEQGRTRCPRWGAVAAITSALGLDRHERAELASAWTGGPPDEDVGCEAEACAVRIGVLGPLTAVRHGSAVTLGSPRQRAVLGLLALQGPAGVPRDVIVDMLWGERPPRGAVAAVQAYVSRLRRLLEPNTAARDEGWPVPLADRSYRLGDGVGVDAAEFRQSSRRADMAAARGEFRLACALYERSLALWRGEVLADVDLLRGYPAAVEAARRRAEVVLRFARASAASGGHERALPYLRRLCACEPFHEQAHADLMTALAATGQQAAALRLFEQLSGRLDAELGVRPGPQVTAAHLRILRQQAG